MHAMSGDGALVRVKQELASQGAKHAGDYTAHIETALASRNGAPKIAPRTLAEMEHTLGRAPYIDNLGALRELTESNCHIGQRKLALALIEFMNISASIHRTADLFVVYAGASILASLAAAELYPTARFLCYDPSFDATVTNVRQELGRRADLVMRNVHIIRAKTAEKRSAMDAFANGKSIVVYCDGAGMYGDESHALVAEIHADLLKQDARKREVVFCSDVRMDVARAAASGTRTHEPSELQIATDMISQAVWTQKLGVRCFQLKFRMPFALEPEIEGMYEQLYSKLNITKQSEDRSNAGTLPYLDGECYVQLYARETSAELRLVGTGGVKLKRYSLSAIEETMAAFNVVHRSHTCFKSPSGGDMSDDFMRLIKNELSPKSLPCVSYEAMCEGSIIHAALRVGGGPRDIVTLRQKMRNFASLYSLGRHPQTCAVHNHQNPRNHPRQKHSRHRPDQQVKKVQRKSATDQPRPTFKERRPGNTVSARKSGGGPVPSKTGPQASWAVTTASVAITCAVFWALLGQ
jgi:hypothetical protein